METSDSSGNGFLVGIVLLLLLVVVFFVYALPMLRSSMQTTAPQVNIPDHVNVNVQHTK